MDSLPLDRRSANIHNNIIGYRVVRICQVPKQENALSPLLFSAPVECASEDAQEKQEELELNATHRLR
jgi:hypothetical protein